MAGGSFSSGRAFAAKFAADMKRLSKNLSEVPHRAAVRAAAEARERAPEATGFLKESIHAVGMRVVCDAPYAMAVERGARPHWPPIAPILAWVELKGFAGLSASGKPQDAKSIAYAIAHKISVEGTKPTWFMRGSILATVRFVGLEVKAAFRSV